jgi:hypothetical protein
MMTTKCYKASKFGTVTSVGYFGNDIYALRFKPDCLDNATYYQITKDEFNQYNKKLEASIMYTAMVRNIILCSDYIGESEFDENFYLKFSD